jgi:hypothetical protein
MFPCGTVSRALLASRTATRHRIFFVAAARLTASAPQLFIEAVPLSHDLTQVFSSYAHFKLTRCLLGVTCDARCGDSMERVMYHTVLGAKPLQSDGSTFYYSHASRRYIFSGAWIPSSESVSTSLASTNSVKRRRNARFCSSASVKI